MTHQFKLGDVLTDSITGIEGVATARYEFLTSCEQYSLEFVNNDGKIEYHAFDYTRLTKTGEAAPLPGNDAQSAIQSALDKAGHPQAAG